MLGLNIFKRVNKLEKEFESQSYLIRHVLVKRDDLRKIQDKICEHRHWQDWGIVSNWRELHCQDCGKVIALTCPHGGSVACDDCVRKFIEENEQGMVIKEE